MNPRVDIRCDCCGDTEHGPWGQDQDLRAPHGKRLLCEPCLDLAKAYRSWVHAQRVIQGPTPPLNMLLTALGVLQWGKAHEPRESAKAHGNARR